MNAFLDFGFLILTVKQNRLMEIAISHVADHSPKQTSLVKVFLACFFNLLEAEREWLASLVILTYEISNSG